MERTLVGLGVLLRGTMRDFLFLENIDYREERGFLSSTFHVEGSLAQLQRLDAFMAHLNTVNRTYRFHIDEREKMQQYLQRLGIEVLTVNAPKRFSRNMEIKVRGDIHRMDALEEHLKTSDGFKLKVV